jgi:hypothetical protein
MKNGDILIAFSVGSIKGLISTPASIVGDTVGNRTLLFQKRGRIFD